MPTFVSSSRRRQKSNLIGHRSLDALLAAHQAHQARRETRAEIAVDTLAQSAELAPVFGLAGTLIITPRYGLVIGGTALTASAAQNYVPSITAAPFLYECYVYFRNLGVAAGANSNVICTGRWTSLGAIATASSMTSVHHSSTGSVAVDTTVASGLWVGVTFSVAPSVIPLWSNWEQIG